MAIHRSNTRKASNGASSRTDLPKKKKNKKKNNPKTKK